MTSEERKLAAIVFTDICGFTELMGRDETKAMALLDLQRTILKPIVDTFNGEWLKEIGDGVLISFPSAVNAVTCSLEIQRLLAENSDLTLRIGIHIGDVIKKGGDVFGDGVNIAARLEPLAEPGGICVSERVHEDIKNKPDISTTFQEEQLLKGVEKPIKVYSIFTQMGTALPESENSSKIKTSSKINFNLLGVIGVLVLAGLFLFINDIKFDNSKPHQNSIAVLPFDNMSDEDNSEYFSDGITEDIITYLSKIEGLKVISRTSIMQYKDSKKNIKEIAQELGVSNILEGSVRRSGDKVRITGQLINAASDEHIWAEMYDRTLNDIFTVQTEVAKSIATALETEMTDKDVERLNKTMTTNPDAYVLLQKIKPLGWFIRADNDKRLELYEKASLMDPGSAYIQGRLGQIHTWIYFNGADRTENRLKTAKSFLDLAMDLDPLLAEVHQDMGYYHYVLANYEEALKELDLAVRLDPNNSETFWRQSLVYRRQGNFQESFDLMEKCHILDPKNFMYPSQLMGMCSYIGKSDKFDYYYNISVDLGMEFTRGFDYRVSEKFGRNGNIDEFKKIVDDANKVDHETTFNLSISNYYSISQDFDLALKYIDRLKIKDEFGQTIYNNKSYLKAVIYKKMGNQSSSKQYFQEALIDINDKINKIPDDARLLLAKGRILAYLGKEEEAVKIGETAISYKSIDTDKLQGGDYNYQLAKIYVLINKHDLALKEIMKVFDAMPKNAWIGFLLHDLEMENIQKYKPFRDLIDDMRKIQRI